MSDINKLRNRVNSLAQSMFPNSELQEDGTLIISHESTALILGVMELDGDLRRVAENLNTSMTYVNIGALVLSEVKVTNNLLSEVAQFTPMDLLPGVSLHLAIREDGTANVIAQTVLSADDLDEKELRSALVGVAFTADFLDDELQERHGGTKTFEE